VRAAKFIALIADEPPSPRPRGNMTVVPVAAWCTLKSPQLKGLCTNPGHAAGTEIAASCCSLPASTSSTRASPPRDSRDAITHWKPTCFIVANSASVARSMADLIQGESVCSARGQPHSSSTCRSAETPDLRCSSARSVRPGRALGSHRVLVRRLCRGSRSLPTAALPRAPHSGGSADCSGSVIAWHLPGQSDQRYGMTSGERGTARSVRRPRTPWPLYEHFAECSAKDVIHLPGA